MVEYRVLQFSQPQLSKPVKRRVEQISAFICVELRRIKSVSLLIAFLWRGPATALITYLAETLICRIDSFTHAVLLFTFRPLHLKL